MVTVMIDGTRVEVEPETSILEATIHERGDQEKV